MKKKISTPGSPGRAVGAALAAVLVLFATDAAAFHFDEEELREEGLEIEIDELEVERDDGQIEIDYDLDGSDWRRAERAGLSLWFGVFVERGHDGSGNWNLWYSMPLLDDDGAVAYPEFRRLERDHVVVRIVAVSNGSLLYPGHGLFTDGSLYVAVRGNHEDDHSHGSTTNPHVQRHVDVAHGSKRFYTVETQLSFVGSLHRYQWFGPSYGFQHLRRTFRRQDLLTRRFHRHLHYHHGHTCGCGGFRHSGPHSRPHHSGGHHRSGTHRPIRIGIN